MYPQVRMYTCVHSCVYGECTHLTVGTAPVSSEFRLHRVGMQLYADHVYTCQSNGFRYVCTYVYVRMCCMCIRTYVCTVGIV